MLKVLILLVLINAITNLELFLDEFHSTTIKGRYNQNYTVSVNEHTEYVIEYPISSSKYPYHVLVWRDINAITHHDSVFVVVRQQKEVTSWEVPLVVQSASGIIRYPIVSRTLCHNNMDIISSRNTSFNTNTYVGVSDSIRKYLSVSVFTPSKDSITLHVMVNEQSDFFITENKNYSTSVTPSQPKHYYYKFEKQGDIINTDTVILEVNSPDDICLMVSIQQPSCPVEDFNQDIFLGGKYQTVNRKGGIIIKKSEFPNGFFVVFVAKGDNFACERTSSLGHQDADESSLNNSMRLSNVNFIIRLGISKNDYLIASLSTLGIVLLFYVVFIVLTWLFYYFGRKKRKVHSNSFSLEESRPNGYAVADTRSTSTSSDEIDARLAMSNLMLSDLAKKGENYVEKKSQTYLWHVISIALFYGIPVVQLVVTYQRIVNISGNQDICYYNFLCAHPLFGLSDFNHIFSNVGYMLVGALFLGIVCYKQYWVHQNSGYGIPKHFGLFYAMGVALIMEGVLSACYHICPNQSNFQFDTSFMYVMAVLCIVKIYQNRHPDINVTAYSTFVVLGMAIFIAMIGILNGHILLWILFIILYTVLCVYISFNIYFLSYVKRGVLGIVHEYNEDSNLGNILTPKRKVHFRLLLIATTINITLACLGFACYYLGTDFATYLLGLLMGNVILYLVVYITMKLIHHEKLCVQAIIYCILSMLCWAGGTYFFINNSTAWTVTAADSRKWNRHCSILRFYDFHDIWHLLSAPALFFSFMLLLSLDDDLVNVRQSKIAVF